LLSLNSESELYLSRWLGADALIDCLALLWRVLNMKSAVKKTAGILIQMAQQPDEDDSTRTKCLSYFFSRLIETCAALNSSLYTEFGATFGNACLNPIWTTLKDEAMQVHIDRWLRLILLIVRSLKKTDLIHSTEYKDRGQPVICALLVRALAACQTNQLLPVLTVELFDSLTVA